MVLRDLPPRPSIDAEMVRAFNGATNNARPLVSVVTLSPLEKTTFTPGVNLPLMSSTARVACSPETILRGSSKIRAPEAGGAAVSGLCAGCPCCGGTGGAACCAAPQHSETTRNKKHFPAKCSLNLTACMHSQKGLQPNFPSQKSQRAMTL